MELARKTVNSVPRMKKNFLQIILGFCALSALAETADDLFPLDDLVESLPGFDVDF